MLLEPTSITNLELVTDQIIIYGGIFVLIFGTIGNALNIIVFLSLQTFRRNPCAFCLLVLSISEIGTLVFFILPVTFANIFKNSASVYTLFPCKPRMGLANTFVLLSNSIMSLASIDQRLSTLLPNRHYGFNLKAMRCLIISITVISILHAIPFFVYYEEQPLSGTNGTICRISDNNKIFIIYALYVSLPVVDGLLPVMIMSIFGLLALQNVRSMRKKQVHIIRFRLEQQLTAMVLMKSFSLAITMIPFIIVYLTAYVLSLRTNDIDTRRILLQVSRLFTLLFYINYSVSLTGVT